jgi:hypothetical protein
MHKTRLALLLWSGLAVAQPPDAGPMIPESEHAELAARLARTGEFNAIVGAAGAAEIARMARETPGLSDAERERLRAVGARTLERMRDRLRIRAADAYFRHFAIADLREIVAFFDSPAGRAYTAAIPAILPDLAAAMQGDDLGAEIRGDFCRETGRLCATAGRPAR